MKKLQLKYLVLLISAILILLNASAHNAFINNNCKFVCFNTIMDSSIFDSVYKKRNIVVVRNIWDDGVNTYRIPGLIKTKKGTLISVYDVRYNNTKDLPGNIDVGVSRSLDTGNTWQPMKIIIDMAPPIENNGVGDACILYDSTIDKIFVVALWSKGNHSIAGSMPGLSPDSTGQLVLVSSIDDGITWSQPVSITPQVKKPEWHLFFDGPGSGIVMKNGTLVFPAQYWDESKTPYSTIFYSTDKGEHWTGSILGPKSNTTESQVVETKDGILMLNMRDNRGSYRSVATTNDMGLHWNEHITSRSALIDPTCMGSLIKGKACVKGKIQDVLFFSNPNSTKSRFNITIKASLDLGETWLPDNQLLIDERNSYGYSSLTMIDSNTVGLLYEGIRCIYFVKIPIEDIIKQ